MMPQFRTWLLLVALPMLGCDNSADKKAQAVVVLANPVLTSGHLLPTSSTADVNEKEKSVDRSGPKLGTKSGRKFALLVGVTKYDTLKVNELIGPANDVRIMSQMLKDSFAFADKDIVILADIAGASERPTRVNIKSHFDRLTKEAKAGDQMVVLLGGHGHQQPEQEPVDERLRRRRPDGVEQIFLPCDAGPWDEKKMVVNAIIADEMGVWTKGITDRGASLWLIVDACHSATMLRGSDEVARALPEGTLVPIEALRKARKAAEARKEITRGEPEKPAAKPENLTPKLMALYACQRDQEAPELTAPRDGKTRHGLLTYTVCQVLGEAKTKLTYRDLRDRIQAKYISEWGKMYTPVPLMEGLDEDTEVLGTNSWAGRSQFLLRKKEDVWTISAGQLHGLTEKSILAVYPPAGEADADKVVGHVRIRTSSPTEAEVEPCAFAKMPLPKVLKEGGRCMLVSAEYGSMGLRVAIEGAGKTEGDAHRRAREMLKEIAKESNALIELADEGRSPDVFVRVKGEKFYLLTAEAAQIAKESPLGGGAFGPYTSEQTTKMQEVLTNIARARNLLKVVTRGAANASSELEVEMVKFKNKQDAKDRKGVTVLAGQKGNVLLPGEFVGWRVTNSGRSRVTLDVTVLFVDSQYGIAPLFPKKGEAGSGINRIRPDVSFWVGPYPVSAAKTVGLEHLVVIAVKGEGQPIDFTCLAQPTLERAREVTRSGQEEPLETPLGRMLKGAMYGQGTTRDLGAPVEPDAQAFRLFSWLVPQPQPSEKK
jgi:hypothetical protein